MLGEEACDAFTAECEEEACKGTNNRQKSRTVIEDDRHPIRDHNISSAAWNVMMRLRSNGHEVYVVGGTVRDIILRRRPKDFDVLTTAEPIVVASLFPRAYVLGRSFPIVHVHHDGEVTEVSSFSTNADTAKIPMDAARSSRQAKNRRRAKKVQKDTDQKPGDVTVLPEDSDHTLTWAMARQENAYKRDFTVNALLYDPFSRVLFDYVGGLEDCHNGVLRTVRNPRDSFTEDPARILRAIRIASRAGLVIEAETAEAMKGLSHLVQHLSHGRLQMELLTMMTHGSSCAALNLLMEFQLLPTLLPQHALLLMDVKQGAKQEFGQSLESRQFLFQILRKLDTGISKGSGKPVSTGPSGLARPVDASVLVLSLMAPLVADEWIAECQKSQRTDIKIQLDDYCSIVDTVINRVMFQQHPKNSLSAAAPAAVNLLPRQALESARELLKLEAGLRVKGFGDGYSDDNPYSLSKGKRPKRVSSKKVSSLIPGMDRRLSKSDRMALSLLRNPELGWDSLVSISSPGTGN